MGLERETKRVARTVESSSVFEKAARAGFAAAGVIHLLVGVLALVIVFGGKTDSSQSGALKAIAGAPAGFVLLWVLAVALWCLAVWEGFAGVLVRGDRPHRWGRRLTEWGRGVVFLVLGGIAASVALGAKPDSNRSAEEVSGHLISLPGGVFVLGAIGIGIGAAGVTFVVIGIRRGFRKRMSLPHGRLGTMITVLGAVGYLAKGAALVTVGVLVLVAAVKVDPKAAGGLDSAMSALLALPAGPFLTAAVGVGFIIYGVFGFFRARYADL